ncbi:phage holin family protein [Oceanobacillus halotolerans]|uniref:phage holin family protein n=1 Tax=Oceanobacillus halotolerans TaxID=2663380 RepID=UPI0013DB949F|nr:phage holin family protein [Oceanobacillus halotolerans]
MTGLIVKLLICPIGLIIASWLLPNVNFTFWYQPILLGIVLAIIGYFMEVLMLREETKGLSLFLDFAASVAIIYVGAWLMLGVSISFWGAILTAAILAITEIVQHNWLLRSGRINKEQVSG